MSDAVHVILDEPQSGAWNMAVDQAMLEESLDSGKTFLRLYRWAEPTVSLGYFQDAAEQRDDPRLASLPSVRRLSGGGAILHDQEQTYSCSVPPAHPFSEQPSRLYEIVHATIVAWLAQHGVSAIKRGENINSADEPFLCFLRGAAPDLVVGQHKVLGSAQRRRRGAVLQHGSLLLRASRHAAELPGICDLVPTFPDSPDIWTLLSARLAKCLGDRFEGHDLPESLRVRAEFLVTIENAR